VTYIAEIKSVDWMTYTLNSDNEPRVAEVAKVDLSEYDKISNPVSGKSINLQITEIPKLLHNLYHQSFTHRP